MVDLVLIMVKAIANKLYHGDTEDTEKGQDFSPCSLVMKGFILNWFSDA